MTAQPIHGWVPDDPTRTIASRLVLVRRQLGISQREAAARTGLGYGDWQSLEDGRAARNLDVKVKAICLALGVDRDWLMWGQAGPDSRPYSEVTTLDRVTGEYQMRGLHRSAERRLLQMVA